MKETRAAPSYTSNDLLSSLKGDDARSLNYQTIAQSADEVGEVQNAPAFTMGPYLISSGQTRLLNAISIYSRRGTQYDQLRLLFMNSTALRISARLSRSPSWSGIRHATTPTRPRSFPPARLPHLITGSHK